jgi:hypothetical protein
MKVWFWIFILIMRKCSKFGKNKALKWFYGKDIYVVIRTSCFKTGLIALFFLDFPAPKASF